MAYIDRDKAFDVLTDYYHQRTLIQRDSLREALGRVPTADVVERKKGKWIDNKGLYQCSACKHIWSELWWSASCPIDRMYKIMRYCPSCGAYMRKEAPDV